MVTYVILSEDLSTVFQVWMADAMPQYSRPVMMRIFDVSGLNPPPQIGWIVSDVVKDGNGMIVSASFTQPPGPAMAELLGRRLEEKRVKYLDRRYAPLDRELIRDLIDDPATTVADRTELRKVFHWRRTVVLPYYYGLKIRIEAGEAWESLNVDFGSACNSADPKVKVQNYL